MRAHFQQRGFTLLELVQVIILIGILAAVVGSRFITTSEFDGYLVRDQLIVTSRMAQQRAMYDTVSCYRLNLANNYYSVQRSVDNGANWTTVVPTSNDPDDAVQKSYIRAISGAPLNQSVYFDQLGNTLTNCAGAGGSLVAGTTVITLTGDITLTFNICATGYATTNAC